MTVEEIKESLVRRATIFKTGGIRPTNELLESWIGKINWQEEGETLPVDADGNEMVALASLFLEGLEAVPEFLKGIYLCNVFISKNIFDHLMDMTGYYMVRTYKNADALVPCNYINGSIKEFPLVPSLVDNDYPHWDGGGIPFDIEDEILTLEDEEDIEYYEDIAEECYSMHKIGGYPAYCQAGGWDEENYDFAFQISSDDKAMLNVVDGGSFYFFYNKAEDKWDLQCDFY